MIKHTENPRKMMTMMRLCFCAVLLLAFGGKAMAQGVADSAKVLQMNPLTSIVKGEMRGVQLSGLWNMAHKLEGIQFSLMSNASTTPFRGLQMSGVSNVSEGVEKGAQLSALVNVSSGYMRGLQAGTYNYADTLNGSQLGLINVCTSHPRGVQVGLINYSRDTVAHKVGLVNVNPNTRIDFMVFGGNSNKTSLALRFRNRSTYNIIGFGTHFMGFDENFSGSLYYRIGQYFELSPRWSLSGDVGFAHVETFKKNSADGPERLYSLQARLNADYQINRNLSAFASLGYGDTRYYNHSERYRHRGIVELGLAYRLNPHLGSLQMPRLGKSSREDGLAPSFAGNSWSTSDGSHPWIAAAEVTAVNIFVHCFDRFVLDKDYAQTTMRSLRDNFTNGMVWDNDMFAVNLFAHPYHGGLYFNSARNNGLNFWQSAPYALGGSLMWEFLGETEPPSINDVFATTCGGIAIGEVTYRISDLVLDDSKRGGGRFWREFLAAAICPVKGVNRIARGDAWRVDKQNPRYHDFAEIPVELSITAGNRYLADNGALFRGEHNPYVNFRLDYGDALSLRHNRPYDYFMANVTFGLSQNQPLVSSVHLLGRLWGASVHEGDHTTTMFGFFQHFNYYDSEPVKDGSDQVPFRISEAASFGPGIICRFENIGNLGSLEQRVFIDGILLGGSVSDYYKWIDRDYNMGSGFSAKLQTDLTFPRFGRFSLMADYYRIYTWKGYTAADLAMDNPLFLNAQGDKGNAQLLVISPRLEVFLGRHLSLELLASNYHRRTEYKYYDNRNTHTFKFRAGLTYNF